MKVYPTMQGIEIKGNSVKIGEVVFIYHSVKLVALDGKQYVECYKDGDMEDRFLIV